MRSLTNENTPADSRGEYWGELATASETRIEAAAAAIGSRNCRTVGGGSGADGGRCAGPAKASSLPAGAVRLALCTFYSC